MSFAYERGLVAGVQEEIAAALRDMEALKRDLDSADPSLESLMRLFEQPSEALRERLKARLRARERRPYHLPQPDLGPYGRIPKSSRLGESRSALGPYGRIPKSSRLGESRSALGPYPRVSKLEARLRTRKNDHHERRPYPQADDDCNPGYFSLERVITQLTWRHAEIDAARLAQAALSDSRSALRDAAACQAGRIAALEREIAALQRDAATRQAGHVAALARQTARQAAHIAALERETARKAEHIAALQRQSAARDAIILQQGCIEIPP